MNNYYLEVMVDDEAATLKQLNKLCGIKHDIFFGTQLPRKRLPIEMQVLTTNVVDDQAIESMPMETLKEGSSRSKIHTFHQGQDCVISY
jgi:hypothetical protein